jgi:hypothetical protein
MTIIKKTAQELLSQLQRKEIDSRVIVSCINHDTPLHDFIRDEVHDGRLPDDFCYNTIYESLSAISEGCEENYCLGIEPNVYTHELVTWSILRGEYVDEILTDYHQYPEQLSYFDLLQRAQSIEIEEITSKVLAFVERQAELDNEEGFDYER